LIPLGNLKIINFKITKFQLFLLLLGGWEKNMMVLGAAGKPTKR